MTNTFVIALIILFFSTCGYAAGLKTLIEVGKNQNEIKKVLDGETTNYYSVKGAISKGELKQGMPGEEIKKMYGAPVITLFDKKKNVDKWLYMPAASTHFKGEKLYLFIDKDGKLIDWTLIE